MQFKFLIILAVVVFSALFSQVESSDVGAPVEVSIQVTPEHDEKGGERDPRGKKSKKFKKILKKIGKYYLKKKFGK